MAEEGSGARVARNTLLNALGTLSGVLISLILTPFLIDDLGVAGFGVWALVLSFSFLGGYAAFTDLGVEAAAARYIAEARSDKDVEAEREVASTALVFFTAAGLVLAPLLALLAFPIIDAFRVPADLHDDAVVCLALIGAQLLLELPARAFLASLEGAQRYGAYQLLEFVRALAQAAFFITALVANLGLPGLGAGMVASSGVVLVVGWALVRRNAPELRFAVRYVSRKRFRTLISFGGQYFFIRMMGTLYRQIDKVILGVALGARYVTTYEIANRIHQGAMMAQSIAASALLPATAYLRKNAETLRELYLRGTLYTLAVSLPVTIAAFIFAEDLIRTWVGERLVHATDEARLFLAYLVFVAFHATGAAMLVALGHMRFVMTAVIIFSVVNLGASIALVSPLEVSGVILGLIIAQAVIWIPYALYSFKVFDLGWGIWLRRVAVPNLPGIAVQLITAYPLLQLAHGANNLAFVGLIFLLSVGLSLGTFLGTLERDQRLLLISMMRGALGRPQPEIPAG